MKREFFGRKEVQLNVASKDSVSASVFDMLHLSLLPLHTVDLAKDWARRGAGSKSVNTARQEDTLAVRTAATVRITDTVSKSGCRTYTGQTSTENFHREPAGSQSTVSEQWTRNIYRGKTRTPNLQLEILGAKTKVSERRTEKTYWARRT